MARTWPADKLSGHLARHPASPDRLGVGPHYSRLVRTHRTAFGVDDPSRRRRPHLRTRRRIPASGSGGGCQGQERIHLWTGAGDRGFRTRCSYQAAGSAPGPPCRWRAHPVQHATIGPDQPELRRKLRPMVATVSPTIRCRRPPPPPSPPPNGMAPHLRDRRPNPRWRWRRWSDRLHGPASSARYQRRPLRHARRRSDARPSRRTGHGGGQDRRQTCSPPDRSRPDPRPPPGQWVPVPAACRSSREPRSRSRNTTPQPIVASTRRSRPHSKSEPGARSGQESQVSQTPERESSTLQVLHRGACSRDLRSLRSLSTVLCRVGESCGRALAGTLPLYRR